MLMQSSRLAELDKRLLTLVFLGIGGRACASHVEEKFISGILPRN